MNLKRREVGDVIILELSGKLMGGPDAALFHDTIKDLLTSDRKKIVVNLSSLNWINSTGLGILISGYTSVKNAGGQLKLTSVAERVQSIFMITKLATVFESYPNEDEAVASFGGE
ncbi:MAG: STAS domain-containing protein [Candidatus Eisenbacteria bacterium]|nr:STAS domain-containing protein [Candidatus Eisenbacteria bacterium]